MDWDSFVQPEILEAEASLSALLKNELEGRRIRSRVRWTEEGEAPSAFFWDLRIKNFKSILRVRSGTRMVDSFSSISDLLNVHERFYSALFPEDDIQDLLISFISREASLRNTVNCVRVLWRYKNWRMQLRKRNKTPSPDGLTAEFYSAFLPSLGF